MLTEALRVHQETSKAQKMAKEADMSVKKISTRTLDNFKETLKSNVSNPMDSRSCIFITFWNNLLLLLSLLDQNWSLCVRFDY